MSEKKVIYDRTHHCDVCEHEQESCAKVYVNKGNPMDIRTVCVEV